jgi:hypothetical protein
MKTAVFWGITLRRVVIVYRRFGTTYRSHPYGSYRVRIGKLLRGVVWEIFNDVSGQRIGPNLTGHRVPEYLRLGST